MPHKCLLNSDFLPSVFEFEVPCSASCRMLVFFFHPEKHLVRKSPLILFQTAPKLNI